MRGTLSPIAASAIAALALIGAGCGGSDSTLSRAQLVARADAICKRAIAQRQAIKVKTQREFAQALPRVASYDQATFAELGRLRPPASLTSDWNQLVAGGQALAKTMVQLGRYLSVHDVREARLKFQSVTVLLQAISATATQDGVQACAQI